MILNACFIPLKGLVPFSNLKHYLFDPTKKSLFYLNFSTLKLPGCFPCLTEL